ncbi:MAG: glycosyltransferase [Pseudomonadota bacterium]
MTPPLFSIIIPTRDRPDTLELCLTRLRSIDYDTVEFVVYDNHSSRPAQELIARHAEQDQRIVPVRSPARVSMRQSFEAGLRNARGLYCGIFGDDDALCPHSLRAIERLLLTAPPDAVAWPRLSYYWPALSNDGCGFVDVSTKAFFGSKKGSSVQSAQRRLLGASTDWSSPHPSAYHGFVSRRLINRILAATIEVFRYPWPDLFSACLIPFFAESVEYLPRPASVRGYSSRSSTIAWHSPIAAAGPLAEVGNQWAAETAFDPEKPNGWSNSIKSHQYHVTQCLKRIVGDQPENGDALDVEAQILAMIAEVERNPALLAGYRQAWDAKEGDSEIVERIVAGFADIETPAPKPALVVRRRNTKHLALRSYGDVFTDDASGAMDAINSVAGTDYAGKTHLEAMLLRPWLSLKILNQNLRFRRARKPKSSFPQQKAPVDFFADDLGVRQRILPFEEDKPFLRAWHKTDAHNRPLWPGGTPDVRWRAHTACWAASQALSTEGDLVECGVGTGLMSLTICGYIDIDKSDKTFWLFDKFAGMAITGTNATAPSTDFDQARRAFARFDKARLVQGTLPDSLNALSPENKIAFLAIDLGDAPLEMEVINRLWARVANKGIVLIDDFGSQKHRAQHDAWTTFAKENRQSVLGLPTGQGLILKS